MHDSAKLAPLHADVFELARTRGEIRGELPLACLPRLIAELLDSEGCLRFHLAGRLDERGRAAAELNVEGRVRMTCDRCGAAVEVSILEHGSFFFVSDEAELMSLPIDDAPDEPLLGSAQFDIAALVEDQALLALPISPRHADCKGAEVGAGQASGSRTGDSYLPFEALARLNRSWQH